MNPTTNQIEEMTREQVESAIKKLDEKYDLERTIVRYTDEVDGVVNTLCDLNRRIEVINQEEGYQRAAETFRANKQRFV